MSWQNLIADDETLALPWTGGRKVYSDDRSWTIQGRLPKTYGWYEFNCTSGRQAKLLGGCEANMEYGGGQSRVRGYLVGDMLSTSTGRLEVERVYCLEDGIMTMSQILAVRSPDGKLVFVHGLVPEPADTAVYDAYCDKLEGIKDIPDVSPGLDSAFHLATYLRKKAEADVRERREALEREQRQAEMLTSMSTAVGRRALSAEDFIASAKSALEAGGATLLDVRNGYAENEKVVRYRVSERRMECVCDVSTLRIIDSGVCLTDHASGKNYDTLLTLETLPSVINEAIAKNKLVVWRHA